MTFSYGVLHMDAPVLTDQQRLAYITSPYPGYGCSCFILYQCHMSSPSNGYIVGQTDSLALVRQPVQKKGNSKLKPTVLRLKKLTLCHILLMLERLAKYMNIFGDRVSMLMSFMDSYTWLCQCWPISKNLQQICADTGCSLEDLLGPMVDRDRWRERESGKSMPSAQLDDDDDDEFWLYNVSLKMIKSLYV